MIIFNLFNLIDLFFEYSKNNNIDISFDYKDNQITYIVKTNDLHHFEVIKLIKDIPFGYDKYYHETIKDNVYLYRSLTEDVNSNPYLLYNYLKSKKSKF